MRQECGAVPPTGSDKTAQRLTSPSFQLAHDEHLIKSPVLSCTTWKQFEWDKNSKKVVGPGPIAFATVFSFSGAMPQLRGLQGHRHFRRTCLNLPICKLKTEGSSYTLLRLLFVLPTYSPQRPSFPETALNRIDTIFFSHVPVCRPIRPLAPETLLDLL